MSVILALYPNARGFGYACIERATTNKAQKLLNSGTVNVRPMGNEKALKFVRKFTEYFKPEIVILRDYHKLTKRGERIQALLKDIAKIAEELNVPFYRYTREQIRFTFEQYGATTKYQISQKIIEAFPELATHSPRIRKVYENEDYRMGRFDAIALATTHEYLGNS